VGNRHPQECALLPLEQGSIVLQLARGIEKIAAQREMNCAARNTTYQGE